MKENTIDWSELFAQKDIEKLLLGNTVECFLPEDGKSSGLYKSFRWFHNRALVISKLCSYYASNNQLDFLVVEIDRILSIAIKSDSFVCLEIVANFIGVIYQEDYQNVNTENLYISIEHVLKTYWDIIRKMDVIDLNVPEDYPGNMDKYFDYIDNRFQSLDSRYLNRHPH